MKTNLKASQAIQIAMEYQKRYNLYGVIHDDIERSVKFYNEFYRVKGSAWLVLADITPKVYEGDDEITFVISDEAGEVDHILDHNGIPHRYHLSSNREYTDEEFEAIFNEDDDE
ncbi:hypothetical protein PAECIP112173_01478 [Paenibacillus sp. JJ-100]|uniref:hypothetical protein n=1 Tax=Paenibacillus sp. JJ-100 TaxID=2974896 RepID=UPI0022FF89EE|nr:hypothetical protein [Paenibacillus sp. JJ-100]CAI6053227.1 hypothetical protein PAECIP112173_01478 [Paenibacillus sp. JJ-100]